MYATWSTHVTQGWQAMVYISLFISLQIPFSHSLPVCILWYYPAAAISHWSVLQARLLIYFSAHTACSNLLITVMSISRFYFCILSWLFCSFLSSFIRSCWYPFRKCDASKPIMKPCWHAEKLFWCLKWLYCDISEVDLKESTSSIDVLLLSSGSTSLINSLNPQRVNVFSSVCHSPMIVMAFLYTVSVVIIDLKERYDMKAEFQ